MPYGGSATTLAVTTTPANHGYALRLCALRSLTHQSYQLPSSPVPTATILALGSESVEALQNLHQQLIHILNADIEDEGDRLATAVYTTPAAGGPQGRYRIAASGSSKGELLETLHAAKVMAVPERQRKVIFLFSGQGGQYAGMGAELYKTVPIFREAIDQCQELLVSWGFTAMLPFIQGVPSKTLGDASLEAEHTAMFALEYGLARMWTTWGVRPDVVLGQSLGEYVALVWSHVLSLEDGLRLVWQRARLTRERCAQNASGMMVVTADIRVVEDCIREYDRLSMVCYNTDENTIVGGDMEQLKLLEDVCEQKGWWHRTVAIPYAFHTNCMEPILDGLLKLGKTVTISPPSIPVVSAARGLIVEAGDPSVFSPGYFAHHARHPVLFRDSIDVLASRDPELASNGVWLEIGPHITVLPLLKLHKAVSEHCLQANSMRRGESDGKIVCQTLAGLYCAGVEVDWWSKVVGPQAE